MKTNKNSVTDNHWWTRSTNTHVPIYTFIMVKASSVIYSTQGQRGGYCVYDYLPTREHPEKTCFLWLSSASCHWHGQCCFELKIKPFSTTCCCLGNKNWCFLSILRSKPDVHKFKCYYNAVVSKCTLSMYLIKYFHWHFGFGSNVLLCHIFYFRLC